MVLNWKGRKTKHKGYGRGRLRRTGLSLQTCISTFFRSRIAWSVGTSSVALFSLIFILISLLSIVGFGLKCCQYFIKEETSTPAHYLPFFLLRLYNPCETHANKVETEILWLTQRGMHGFFKRL
ncbi:unnamed protein product [Rotaria socialis]